VREDVANRVRALAQHHRSGPLRLGYLTELYAYERASRSALSLAKAPDGAAHR
jgi:hypothetical protein